MNSSLRVIQSGLNLHLKDHANDKKSEKFKDYCFKKEITATLKEIMDKKPGWKEFEYILKLLKRGADPKTVNSSGQTLIHLCILNMLEVFSLPKDEVTRLKNKLDRSYSQQGQHDQIVGFDNSAALNHGMGIIKTLIKIYGIDINQEDNDKIQALEYVCGGAFGTYNNYNKYLILDLLKFKPNGFARSKNGVSCLQQMMDSHDATYYVEMATNLVKCSPQAYVQKEGSDWLQTIINHRHCIDYLPVVIELIKRGVSPDIQNTEGLTCLQIIMNQHGYMNLGKLGNEIIELLKAGANYDVKAKDGKNLAEKMLEYQSLKVLDQFNTIVLERQHENLDHRPRCNR